MDVGIAAHMTLLRWYDKEALPPSERSEDGRGLPHARWLLETVMKEATTWKNDKLNRWLGYAQAILVESQVLSLQAVKLCNQAA